MYDVLNYISADISGYVYPGEEESYQLEYEKYAAIVKKIIYAYPAALYSQNSYPALWYIENRHQSQTVLDVLTKMGYYAFRNIRGTLADILFRAIIEAMNPDNLITESSPQLLIGCLNRDFFKPNIKTNWIGSLPTFKALIPSLKVQDIKRLQRQADIAIRFATLDEQEKCDLIQIIQLLYRYELSIFIFQCVHQFAELKLPIEISFKIISHLLHISEHEAGKVYQEKIVIHTNSLNCCSTALR